LLNINRKQKLVLKFPSQLKYAIYGHLPHRVFVTRTSKHAANMSANLLANSKQILTNNILSMLSTQQLHFHKTGVREALNQQYFLHALIK